ncbi:hypothetical protein Tco_1357794, partial [Tanacetum coccineum]
MQTEEVLTGDDLKHYEVKIGVMNLILISIPNEIYNSVDAFTQVRLAKILTEYTYDDLFNYLQQLEKLVNASRAKKLEKSHDPFALVAHMGSSSRTPSPYYVTHPSSEVDYDDDYQGEALQANSKDPLTSAMILFAHAITQCFSNPTNNCLRTSSNTRNQAIVQADRVNIQSKDFGTYRELFELRLQELLQMFNAIIEVRKDEAIVILTDEQNDFLITDATRMEEIEEL